MGKTDHNVGGLACILGLTNSQQSCEGTLAKKEPYPIGTKIPYDKVARWDSYGTIR